LEAGLTQLLSGLKKVAMEYSPMCAIPYLSRVDAGTVEMIRARGLEIVSSGDLVQQFEAAWTNEQLATHRAASESLYRIKDRAFSVAFDAVAQGRALTEYELQQQMVKWFEEEGLVTDSPPVVAVGGNAGNPHYLPTPEQCQAVVADEVLLLDLWGKKPDTGAVFADITWLMQRERGAICGDGKWMRQLARCSRVRATATESCIAPVTASGSRCMETASTWTTTKPTTIAGCCPGPALLLNPASISNPSASAPRSTCTGANARQL
jgi:hypothetical protein